MFRRLSLYSVNIQIGLVNDVLNNLLGFFNSDVDKLSTGEEVVRNTLVILNQVIAKIWQKRQIWDVNDDVMLRHKAMQIKRLHSTKESTPGIKYGLLITIPLVENFVKNKKEESKKISEEISQLLTRICMLIQKLKDYRIYIWCCEDGIGFSINSIFNKY